MINKNEFYYSELPWEIIKSYILTFDKTRCTKSAKIMKPLCEHFRNEIEDDSNLINDNDFQFLYFYTMMNYHTNFNYSIFP